MEHRRLDDRVPDPGVAGDTHVAGPGPEPLVPAAPEPVPDTAPDPMPAADPMPADAVPDADPMPEAVPAAPPAEAATPAKLLEVAEADGFRERWHEVQASFIDDPGEAVRRADDLASDAVDALGRAIATHRRTLSEALGDGGRPDTERLRLALRDYRDLLDRIFAA